MVRLKLIKGLSYTGDVKATADKPYVEAEEATAEKLVASGYFKKLGGETDEIREIAPEDPEESEGDELPDLSPETPEDPEESEPETDGKAATGSTKKTSAKSKK